MPLSANVVRLTNCRLILAETIVKRDLWISADTGRILDPQSTFFAQRQAPARTVDCDDRLIAPGFIDLQLNGCFGVDFGAPQDTAERFEKKFAQARRALVESGVTSFAPTVISTSADAYRKASSGQHLRRKQILPHLARPPTRDAVDGAEPLGAHLEGPFLSPRHHGIHQPSLLRSPLTTEALDACYGAEWLRPPWVSMVTLAPELDASGAVISELRARGIVVCVGHTDADYDQTRKAVADGASMVTHMYNAMRRPHHREPGVVGVLGMPSGGADEPAAASARPYFGLIVDGIHVHPSMVRLAYAAHPGGCVLVTDAIAVQGLPNKVYRQARGEMVRKTGLRATSAETGRLAGSCVTLIECLNNLIHFTGLSLPEAVRAVTMTPAKVLDLQSRKGTLEPGADADLVELYEIEDEDGPVSLLVHEVWKFGKQIRDNALLHNMKPRL